MSEAIFTVGQLTRAVKGHLEGAFPFVWVRGQISNCSRPSSGHVYFSLKDDEAVLNAVWFKNQQRDAENFDPLTGEVFENGPRLSLARTLENGQEIICAGRLTVYPPRGAYQLVVELAQDAGTGRLQLEFERIKAALLSKGYFAPDRKRPMPVNPARVAVVTALSGAVIQDFLRMAAERGAGAEVRIYPTQVQGNNAPAQIAQAIQRAAEDSWGEVVALIRGGGSLEDLWAFNAETVADAIFHSPLPVVAGIGHEPDVSIADLVADLRAATPTHAAQLLWTERRELVQRVDELETLLGRLWDHSIGRWEENLASLTKALAWLSPERTLGRWTERLTTLEDRLGQSMLAALNRREHALASLEQDLPRTFTVTLDSRERHCERLALCLAGLDPMRPLERGYALARNASGTFVRTVTDVRPGDRLDLVVRDGTIPVCVEDLNQRNGK